MKQVLMSQLAVQVRGVSYKPDDLHSELNKKSIILLRANNIDDGKINFDDVVYVDRSKVSDNQLLRNGDILICASSGSKSLVGKAAQVDFDGEVTFGAFCKVVRPTTIESNYLGMYFQSPTYRLIISALAQGANINNIKNENINTLLVNVPAKNEQTEAVKILKKVQVVIHFRQQQLQKLDELVKARFIELFGTETEFDKWPCCTIGDVADVCVGVVIKPTQYYTDKGIPAFRSLNIGEMHVKDSDWVYFTEDGHQKNQKSVVHKNDVLVVRSGAPGTACVATEKYDGYNAVDIIIAHPDNSKVNSIFLAAFTNMPHGMNQIRERTGGAAQQHFNVGGYKAMRLIMPSIELQNQYAAFVEQTDKSKVAVQKALDEAQLLFDSLMQKYFG